MVFYKGWLEAVENLNDKEFKKATLAILNYGIHGIECKENGIANVVFNMAKGQIDANNKRYENGKKGAEYGKLGGAPKGNQNARKQPQNNPKTTPNVNVNVNVNENANENVSVNDNDDEKKSNHIISIIDSRQNIEQIKEALLKTK